MILAIFFPKWQILVSQAQRTMFFYPSPTLKLHLKVFTKLRDFSCKNTKFSSFPGGHIPPQTIQTLCRAGPRGRAREWATLGVHPLSWLLSNNRSQEVCGTLTKGTFSSRLLLSNQDKGCTPSVVLPLALHLGPALHNLSTPLCAQARNWRWRATKSSQKCSRRIYAPGSFRNTPQKYYVISLW